MRKRCVKGKNCGGTCIDRRERCVLELGTLVSNVVGKARQLVLSDRKEFVGAMKDMGAGTKTAKSEAIRQFPSPSSPKSLPSDLKAALKALPPPTSSPKGPVVLEGRQLSRPPEKSRQISMSVLPNGREDLMALRRSTLLKFIDEKNPDTKNKLEAKIDAIDRKLEAQKKIPSTWPTFVAPLPTTSSEIRKDIASIVKDASAPSTQRAKEELISLLKLRTGGNARENFFDAYDSMNTNNVKSWGKIALNRINSAIANPSFASAPSDTKRLYKSLAGKLSANIRRLDEAPKARSNPVAVAEERLRVAREQKDVKGIQDAKKALDAAKKANYISPATGNTRFARNDAVDSDRNLGLAIRLGDKNYDGWRDSYGSGSQKVGEGSFGTVIRNPDGTFVKRGAVSSTEAQLIKRLGEANLGPKLIAADINGKHEYMDARGVNMRDGRIAMTAVAGSPMGQVNPYVRRAGEFVPNIYWKAMADIHRLGIAHNDAHIDNILIDDKGKGRWVDLGLAQSSPKAALAEALGTFKPPAGKPTGRARETPTPKSSNSSNYYPSGTKTGNWQTRRWGATGIQTLESYQNQPAKLRQFKKEMPVLGKIVDNLGGVNSTLREKYGMSNQDIADIYAQGIRSPLSSYTKGAWAKMTDQQAQELLNQLYEGV